MHHPRPLALFTLTLLVAPVLAGDDSPRNANRQSSLSAPDTLTTLFAGVASAPGANNTQWRSEVVLTNIRDAAADVTLEIIPRGEADVVGSHALTLAPGETRHIPDLYAAMSIPSGAGTLRVTGDVLAWVRTFNQAASGTFGTDVPPVTTDTAFSPGAQVVFPINTPADVNTEFRSNLLLLNLESTSVTFTLSSGTVSRSYDVPAGVFAQISGLGAWLGLSPGTSMLTVTANGRWSGIVTTIDPVLGDPTTVRGLVATTRTVTQFSGAASASGANGTQWRSEATLYNPRMSPQSVKLELIPRGESAVASQTTLNLAPLQLQRLADVYTALGAASGAGTLRVTGDVLTWVRTFNQGAARATFGTDVPEVVPGVGYGPGAGVSFPVTTPADAGSDFRSNLLVCNHESRTITLTIAARATSTTLDVPAGTFLQESNVGAWLGLPSGVSTLSITANGRWSGMVTTIDPVLGDPTTVLGILTTGNPAPTAAGTPTGSAATATIGPSGGVLASADGRLQLTVPAGALAAPAALSIQPITNLAWGGVGAAYRLGPDGTTFSKPATLTFSLSAANLTNASIGAFAVATQDADGYWVWMPGVVRNAGPESLSVPTTHLSDYSPLQGLQLSPLSASIDEGQTQALSIQDCCEGCLDDPADPLAPLTKTFPCTAISGLDPAREEIFTDNWSVNGTPGGNSTVGTIVNGPMAIESTYTAPSSAPNPPTVGASVDVTYRGSGKIVLVSQITVGTPKSLSGTFSTDYTYVDQGFRIHANGEVTFTLTVDGSVDTSYSLDGTALLTTMTYVNGRQTCTLADDPHKPVHGYLFVWKAPVLALDWGYANLEPWHFSCTEGSSTYPNNIVVAFGTATDSGCGTFSHIPMPDAKHTQGSFTETCPHYISVTSWNFHF